MKITQETTTLMVLNDRNILLFLLGAAIILVGFAAIFYPSTFIQTPPLWFGAFFFFMGLLIILKLPVTTVVLDKTTNKLSITLKTLVGKKVQEYDLNQINEIQLQQFYSGGKGRRATLKLVFILSDG
ncbi:MAG: hypothetical protein AB1468_01835, partial [Candidatus Micrarchaeota archaeon]